MIFRLFVVVVDVHVVAAVVDLKNLVQIKFAIIVVVVFVDLLLLLLIPETFLCSLVHIGLVIA